MNDRRLVLIPQGLPNHPESRERCLEIILRCGGDLGRLFDGSDRSIERFAQHIAGIADVVNAREVPLVVLTKLEPIETQVLRTRRILEAEIAMLERAPWILYADPFVSEYCFETLQRLGTLDGSALAAPLWTARDHLRYLVVSPLMRGHVMRGLPERVHRAEFGCSSHSATRPLRHDEASFHPTLEVASPVSSGSPIAAAQEPRKIR